MGRSLIGFSWEKSKKKVGRDIGKKKKRERPWEVAAFEKDENAKNANKNLKKNTEDEMGTKISWSQKEREII